MIDEKAQVAVLMGGWSAERDVSLSSGKACAEALRAEGFSVTEVDVQRNIASHLEELKPDVCFNALHGPFGEDGCIQGILEVLNIPYTHSGVLASSMAMNKKIAKEIIGAAGVPIASDKIVKRGEAALGHLKLPPYVLKPVADGSSVGIFIVKDIETPPPGADILAAGSEDDDMIIEEFVDGLELTCGVLGNRALDVTEIRSDAHEFYDYDAKYAPGGSQHILPAEISPNIYQFIQKWTLTAHTALGCRGVSRADFRYDEKKDLLVCLEVNTQPGMTSTSLLPEMAEKAGWSFNELVRWILEDASCNR
ncbi:D-alanine--D-alanine ligase [Hyphomicrobiales bacterium 4NK60-0047b]